jgi:hypothetical protein
MTQIMRKLRNDKNLLGVTGIHVVQIKTIGHASDSVFVYSNLIFFILTVILLPLVRLMLAPIVLDKFDCPKEASIIGIA